MGKIKSPAEPESISVPVKNRRSNTGYGEARAGLGSVTLDERPAKPTKTDKAIKKNPKVA